ncbi:hypothetical protein RHMOL_Rhmol10G0247400 [Rhododendron molle]|uniref:Uncharacterized protein n=1 Tax=Rhododendron molle TaxID=49168 RepID=A0ACC0M7L4_RHOML|nr:hypothetical protein RHMOL_Rhmol10G0247400 [Rhododendron molle]
MDFQRERRVDNGIGGQHHNFRLAFCRQKRKRLFNTRLSHSPPTPPLTLPLLKDKEPPLAAVDVEIWKVSNGEGMYGYIGDDAALFDGT